MPKTSPTIATLKVSFRIPETLYDAYAERAAKHGRDPEEEIMLRLRQCREHTATSPLYFTDEQRNALSVIAGQTLKTADDVLAWAKQISTITVAHIDVDLSERLLTRLETRRFGKPMDEHVKQVVTEQLEQYVGMR